LDELLKSFVFPGGFWVSATELKAEPGNFSWADGVKVDKTFFDGGQPDNLEQKDFCLFMYTRSGKLHDFPCNEATTGGICELAKEDLPCK